MLAVALHMVMSMILAFEYMLHEYFSWIPYTDSVYSGEEVAKCIVGIDELVPYADVFLCVSSRCIPFPDFPFLDCPYCLFIGKRFESCLRIKHDLHITVVSTNPVGCLTLRWIDR